LSRLPGNYSLVYSQDKDGTVLLTDTLVHDATINVKDVAGNVAVLSFKFRWDPAITREWVLPGNANRMVPERENILKTDNLEVTFSNRAFYDTVPFVLRSVPPTDTKVVSSEHYLHNYTIPVHDSFTVRIKPTSTVLFDREKVVMQLVSNHKVEAVKGVWQDDWMAAKFRDLGLVRLIFDDVPPTVSPSGFKNGGLISSSGSISFTVKDNAGEIKSFQALEDGNWLLFKRKNYSFIHTFDEKTTSGSHELVVRVEDMAGNVTEKTYNYTTR
jgi:hypothetical protein